MTDWETEEWRAQATAWMDARLEEHGIARTGEVEQPRVRPWATVLRAETSDGVVWMKACGPENAFEAGLYEVLEAAAPGRVVEWSEQLAAAPVDPSVDHNDLHGDNILTGNRFYDWGDAVIAHPFASMLVPLTMQRRQDGTQTARLRDGYLEAFTDLATRRELEETLELACHVGKIARTLTWLRAIEHFDPAEKLRWAKAPVACMTALLDDEYLGGA